MQQFMLNLGLQVPDGYYAAPSTVHSVTQLHRTVA